MFYTKYKDLCDRHGESPYGLVMQLGAKSNSVVDAWKRGSTPRQPMLKAIADYFGVPVSYFLDDEQKEKPTATVSDGLEPERAELIRYVRNMPIGRVQAFLALLKDYKDTLPPLDPEE